jgi:HEAT repeat protein
MEVAGAVASGTAEVDTLGGYLGDADPAVRWWAAMGLGNDALRAKRAVPLLRGALSDKSMVVRVAVARAIDRAGDTDAALPILTSALNHENPSTALWAISVLDEMDAQARPALSEIQAAANQRANEYVMRVAKAALGDLSKPPN